MKIFQELIDSGFIKEEKIDISLIKKVLAKAHRGLKSSLASAEKLVSEVEKILQRKNPQKKLAL